MHHDRMRLWINRLIDFPDANFSLNSWLDTDWSGNEIRCAASFATTISEFRALGLHENDGIPIYNGNVGDRAIAAFFGMSMDEAQSIIYPSHYKSWEGEPPKPWWRRWFTAVPRHLSFDVSKERVIARMDAILARYPEVRCPQLPKWLALQLNVPCSLTASRQSRRNVTYGANWFECNS